MARPNAPTYPDADHNAPTTPMTRPRPTAAFWVSWLSGSRIVSATAPAPTSESTPTSASVLPSWPKMPSSETMASSAGKSARTP